MLTKIAYPRPHRPLLSRQEKLHYKLAVRRRVCGQSWARIGVTSGKCPLLQAMYVLWLLLAVAYPVAPLIWRNSLEILRRQSALAPAPVDRLFLPPDDTTGQYIRYSRPEHCPSQTTMCLAPLLTTQDYIWLYATIYFYWKVGRRIEWYSPFVLLKQRLFLLPDNHACGCWAHLGIY